MNIINVFSGNKQDQIKYICDELELPYLESMNSMEDKELDIMYNQIVKFKKTLGQIKEAIDKYKVKRK